MTERAKPQTIILESARKKKTLAQGQAIVNDDFVAITKLTIGIDWLEEWGKTSRGTSFEIVVLTADKKKTILTEGFMSLYYWSEGAYNPKSEGWEQYAAILRKHKEFSGSFAQKIWHAAQANERSRYGEECFIYSDVSFVGELRGVGPVDIINNAPQDAQTMASLTLRYNHYQSVNDFNYTKTSFANYQCLLRTISHFVVPQQASAPAGTTNSQRHCKQCQLFFKRQLG